jgi:hypothetical protein
MSPSRPAEGPSDIAGRPSLATRAHLVGGALLAGVAVGSGGVGVGTAVTGVATAADTGFLVGLVAFGFGLLGWAGSIIAGPGLEAMQAQLETASGWSEADSRRAMARIGSFGAGVMLAAILVGTALGYS